MPILTRTRDRFGSARQAGVGFVELLCAVVILSLGMLAAGAMQMTAMRSSEVALHRGYAMGLAEDIVSRMRANRAGLESAAYAGVDTWHTAQSTGCLAEGCGAQGLAQADIAAWTQDLKASSLRLPPMADGKPARGSITLDDDGVYVVRLEWGTFDKGAIADDTLELRVSL